MKEENDLISIIVPIYNAEKYIDKCIASIVKQTYTNIEIILIDDNSNDNSLFIEKKWKKKDSRINIIVNKGDECKHGTANARNIGLKVAHGDLIAFSDDDDTMKPNMLERLHSLMMEYKSKIAFCSREVISDWYIDKWEDKGIIIFENGYVDINKRANQFDANMVWLKLYKRELFDYVKFPDDILFGDDLFVQPDLFEQCDNIVYTSERLYNYSLRRDNTSFTLKIDDKYLESDLRSHLKFFEYCANKGNCYGINITNILIVFAHCVKYGSLGMRTKSLQSWKTFYKKYEYILKYNKKAKLFYYAPKLFLLQNSIYKFANRIKRDIIHPQTSINNLIKIINRTN